MSKLDIIVAMFDQVHCESTRSNVELTIRDIHLGYFLEVIVCAKFYFIIFLCVYENREVNCREPRNTISMQSLTGYYMISLYQTCFPQYRKGRNHHKLMYVFHYKSTAGLHWIFSSSLWHTFNLRFDPLTQYFLKIWFRHFTFLSNILLQSF